MAQVFPPSKRIHVAYLSPNYYEHAVAYLWPNSSNATIRTALRGDSGFLRPRRQANSSPNSVGCGAFLDIRALSELECCGLLQKLGVDIAIDLTGHTAMARTGILACGPAPIQVNYLGYPGTMGADLHRLHRRRPLRHARRARSGTTPSRSSICPTATRPNDTQAARSPSARRPARELGLPEDGFVFCCFNNSYKIKPTMFDVWMRLLAAGRRAACCGCSRTSAWPRPICGARRAARGVAPRAAGLRAAHDRSPTISRAIALADLFLDTLPYNAHTTASDALWAGLPVLTCAGDDVRRRVWRQPAARGRACRNW